MLYIQGLATQKFSSEKAIEYYTQSNLFFMNILSQDNSFYVAQNTFNIGSLLKNKKKYEEAQ